MRILAQIAVKSFLWIKTIFCSLKKATNPDSYRDFFLLTKKE